MNAVSNFFLTYVSGWQTLAILVVAGVLFEYAKMRYYSSGITAAIMFIAGHYFECSPLSITLCAMVYFVIGLFWSIFKYKRHVDRIVARVFEANPAVRHNARTNMRPANMTNIIAAWVFTWPLGMLETLCRDSIRVSGKVLWRLTQNVYNKYYLKATTQLASVEPPPFAISEEDRQALLENEKFKTIESRHRHIAANIKAMWGTREFEPFMRQLLNDTRGGTRTGFSSEVATAIFFLLQEHETMYPHLYLELLDESYTNV